MDENLNCFEFSRTTRIFLSVQFGNNRNTMNALLAHRSDENVKWTETQKFFDNSNSEESLKFFHADLEPRLWTGRNVSILGRITSTFASTIWASLITVNILRVCSICISSESWLTTQFWFFVRTKVPLTTCRILSSGLLQFWRYYARALSHGRETAHKNQKFKSTPDSHDPVTSTCKETARLWSA